MSGKVPLAAFCEEYDEDAHEILPDTRHSASHRAASSSASTAPVVIDGASDSGYSSRTVTSSQSAVSGAKSSPPPPLTLDTLLPPPDNNKTTTTTTSPSPSTTTTTTTSTSTSTPSTTITPSSKRDPNRVHHRKDRTKMQVGSYPSGPYHGSSSHRSSSSQPRDTTTSTSSSRQYPGVYWDYDSAYYPSTGPSTPLDPRTMDYSYYAMSQPATMHDYGLPPPPPPPPPLPPSSSTTSSSHSSRYSLPTSMAPDVHVSSSRPSARSSRSNSYHTNGSRPLSFHGMMPGGGGSNGGGSSSSYYNPSHMARYDHGPPLSASAYANSPSFGPTMYAQQPPYYSLADYGPPSSEHRRERSMSRSREYPKGRRSSMYGSSGGVPVVDYDPAPSAYDDAEPLERGMSRDSRPPMSPHSSSFDHDEDYYRMPPPPLKHKSTPQIIQKRPDPPRKSATTTSINTDRRSSRSFEMAELDAALPDPRAPPSRQPRYRRSRENLIPERSRSLRTSRRRPTVYHDSSTRPSRIAVEGARRRRAPVYNYVDEDDDEDEDEDEDDEDDAGAGQIEEKQRQAEKYQATKAKNSSSNNNKPVPVPLTEDALYKAKASQRAGSDSGSQKTRSSASDARTQSGSNVDSTTAKQQEEENTNFVMSMNGITMSIPQEAVSSKKISLRTGDTGALELNIEGKRPKKYLTSGSEYTGAVARRELEDARRPRDSRRSDRASRRSSRSTYSGRFLA